jgi:hypothetical protein
MAEDKNKPDESSRHKKHLLLPRNYPAHLSSINSSPYLQEANYRLSFFYMKFCFYSAIPTMTKIGGSNDHVEKY